MKCYVIRYTMYQGAEVKMVYLNARNKEEAYDKAVYEEIVKKEGTMPYSAWVESVTYSNGRMIRFNTFEGKPY